jgi:multidrug transporter EmrE-like cation transporter
MLLFGVFLSAPPALLLGDVATAAIPFIAASAALELAYFVLFARAYDGGEVSVVYPIARGLAPVLVLGAGAVLLGEHVSLGAAAGVVTVTVGIFLVLSASAVYYAVKADSTRRDLGFGLAIGVVIAAYALVDAEGVERADPIAYVRNPTPVSAVRESSLVIAAILAAVVSTRRGARRLAGAAAVTAGVAAIALSG